MDEGPRIRPARDDDADGVIALIAAVFSEYPGCVLDVDREEPELRAPASRFDRFWVAEQGGRVVGCIACTFHGSWVELRKLYVDRSRRRQGLGRRLIALVEEEARARGAEGVELWSDTRFEAAHRVYERLGYARTGRTRRLNDLSGTTEFHYLRRLSDRGPGGGRRHQSAQPA